MVQVDVKYILSKMVDVQTLVGYAARGAWLSVAAYLTHVDTTGEDRVDGRRDRRPGMDSRAQ